MNGTGDNKSNVQRRDSEDEEREEEFDEEEDYEEDDEDEDYEEDDDYEFDEEYEDEDYEEDSEEVEDEEDYEDEEGFEDEDGTTDEESDFESVQLIYPCSDKDNECEFWAGEGECVNNPEYMLRECTRSCGVCFNEIDLRMGPPQRILEGHEEETFDRIVEARHYLNQVAEDEFLSASYAVCINDDPMCAHWAVIGECEKSPEWMRRNCAPMCQSCEETSILTRCPVDPNEKNAWEKPGDVNRYFENMTTFEGFQQYEPKVWSRPSYVNGDTEETADYQIGLWVVTLENFLSQEEADRLIEMGTKEGYEASTEYGPERPDGTFVFKVSDYRTSKNAWCEDECAEDPLISGVMERMADVANMSNNNSEYLQLLSYTPGQYYKPHTDHVDEEKLRQPGVRILTVFLYLNSVEEGGGTRFPELDITVEPRLGRVLIWPSVLDEAPHDEDTRSEHEALAVIKGRKYAANGWFHQRNYKGPYATDCV